MNGVNGTIFAYGQTSSGKTFTMHGTKEEPGIIPMAIEDIFRYILETPDREFLLRVSYLEIYNEVIKDLLNPENENLNIRQDPTRGVFVGKLTEAIVLSPEEVIQLMKKGESNRHVGETNMNERSSRSHTIFRMVIESRERSKESKRDSQSNVGGAVKVSSLNLVDLAGSERVGQTGAEGIRLKEGGHINKSLLALGTVIAKLAEQENDRGHIPYRDSKLTRILQPSLGGNARTAIICAITTASNFYEETTSTLKFASRAKTISNKPEVNEVLTDEKTNQLLEEAT
ncbi:kinesin-domain-containing protein [Basidiobolus meristosporus CBS 931.73]|uniref:Kinesin-like protein n=1 Tax=Basidiobolus meristosporus CBS 931.73 TaxID=1314790 RepID=A0A1Y1Z5Z4_9FUNG|nr:kinesin-domain-containing protein [Basidiobolus meristosporus CBS 931.73]|eukprot:ORY05417.1 kinesin-domain-containing protein [Basidiobolus meristosporus CBS 931.73]